LLVVACLIQLGMTQTDATNKIRKVRPGMLQNPAQQMYLVLVEKKLKGLDIEKDIPNMDSLPELKKHKKKQTIENEGVCTHNTREKSMASRFKRTY